MGGKYIPGTSLRVAQNAAHRAADVAGEDSAQPLSGGELTVPRHTLGPHRRSRVPLTGFATEPAA